MSIESLNQNSEELQFFEDITKAEQATLSPELLPMWTAENNACFPHFLDFANSELSNILIDAQSGDINAIHYISIKYEEYRNNLESNLLEFAPELYEQYIEAVRNGDSKEAILKMNEFINMPQIDEDDED